MTGFLKHISCAILLAASLSASDSAQAAPKFTYLKIGQGDSAQAYAFKSKQIQVVRSMTTTVTELACLSYGLQSSTVTVTLA
jgi:hypothetical protein